MLAAVKAKLEAMEQAALAEISKLKAEAEALEAKIEPALKADLEALEAKVHALWCRHERSAEAAPAPAASPAALDIQEQQPAAAPAAPADPSAPAAS